MQKNIKIDCDILVIGAGVVGLAISYYFSKNGKQVILLEKEEKFGSGVSSRNSEVIHAGIYYNKGSLKSKLCIRGKNLLYEYCEKNSVKYKRTGKLFVAVSSEDISRLEIINSYAIANGLNDLKQIDKRKLKLLEPRLKGKAALLSPSSGIIDSHGLMVSLFNQNDYNGTIFSVLSPVIDAEPNSFGWDVKVGGVEPTTIHTKSVVNAAGLYALEISKKIFPNRAIPKSNPVKGGYIRYSGKSPLSHIVYPAITPGKIEERVDATPDLSGSLRFGPSVEPFNGIDDFSLSTKIVDRFIPQIKKYLPDLDIEKLHLDQAGIRPKIEFTKGTEVTDFIFNWADEPGWLDLWGIESPGLTSSLAIGEYVYSLFEKKFFFN
tara:strand:+ start:7383 stop:8513 length:1131 start_codon:yes stop_codon:yes gene_type:complete